MHLAAAVYCAKCDMYVELGTKDCPHAIEMGRETAMSERNVGDSSKDARPEVVEKTGDGSESAGLRERLAELVKRIPDVPEWSHRQSTWVFNGEGYDDGAKADHLYCVALARWADEVAALAPAISRPPTQGSASVSYPCGATASEGSPPNDCPIHGSDCIGGVRKLLKRMTEAATAQPPSLPPSRADLGGDRIRDFALEFAKAWMDAHHTIYNDVMLGSLANKFDEVLKPYQTGESK